LASPKEGEREKRWLLVSLVEPRLARVEEAGRREKNQ
jgi:hypothetical protein